MGRHSSHSFILIWTLIFHDHCRQKHKKKNHRKRLCIKRSSTSICSTPLTRNLFECILCRNGNRLNICRFEIFDANRNGLDLLQNSHAKIAKNLFKSPKWAVIIGRGFFSLLSFCCCCCFELFVCFSSFLLHPVFGCYMLWLGFFEKFPKSVNEKQSKKSHTQT